MSHIILLRRYKCSQRILQLLFAMILINYVSHNALHSTILFKMKLLTAYKIAIAFDKIIVRLYYYLLMYPWFCDTAHAPNLLSRRFNEFSW